MADSRHTEVHRYLHGLFNGGTVAGQSDGELLERFHAGRGETAEMAFAALVERHGPMVLRVCRTVLRDSHDASDAFQATFLVLSRKAGSIHCRDTLGPYLHAVALRVASCTRSAVARRRKHERRYAERSATSYAAEPPDDLGRVLHEELGRLPERFRGVAVLCDLEGRTYVEAAGLLGCPPGTVMSRLAEARRRLRGRLARRGLAPSAVGIAALLATEAEAMARVLPSALAEATIQAATRFAAGNAAVVGPISPATLALTEWVLRTMLMTKLKVVSTVFLTLSIVTLCAMGFARQGAAPPGPPKSLQAVKVSEPAVAPAPPEVRPPGPDKAMAEAKLKVARQAISTLENLQGRGEVSFTDPRVAIWERRQIEALRESGAGKEELIKALERYVSKMRTMGLHAARARPQKDGSLRMNTLDAEYLGLEGEMWLNQEKAR